MVFVLFTCTAGTGIDPKRRRTKTSRIQNRKRTKWHTMSEMEQSKPAEHKPTQTMARTTRLECCTSSTDAPTRCPPPRKRSCDWSPSGGDNKQSCRLVILPADLNDQKKEQKNENFSSGQSSQSFFFLESVCCGKRNSDTMPKSFNKVHKQISKKRGAVEALHENSRDAKRLNRANARDSRVARIHAAQSQGKRSIRMLMILCSLRSMVLTSL